MPTLALVATVRRTTRISLLSRLLSPNGMTPSYQVVTYEVTPQDTSAITRGIPMSGQIELPGASDEASKGSIKGVRVCRDKPVWNRE